MKDFEGKTAVITGAGSGIGRALAQQAAAHAMKLVLADINEADLAAVAAELSPHTELITRVSDVSRFSDVEALAEAAVNRFGKVHLLCNNAGVSAPPERIWETTLKDWNWVTSVNLNSVVYGVHAFIPAMLAHQEEAHVLNTASIAGLILNQRLNAYSVTKHAVVALSETLALDLLEVEAKIGVSVLCPAWVKTKIHEAQRNREADAQVDPETLDPATQQVAAMTAQAVESGISPEDTAKMAFAAMAADQFYILTHPPYNDLIKRRLDTILSKKAPTPNPPLPDPTVSG